MYTVLDKINAILAAIKLSDYKKYYGEAHKKRGENKVVIKYLDFIFGGPADKKGRDRIYLPYDITQSDEYKRLQQRIDSFISREGYRVGDFQQGIAYKEGNKNPIKIGKIINRMKKKFPTEAEELLKTYNESKAGESDYLIVISRHPYDVAGASTGRSWARESCMSLEYSKINRSAEQWKTVPHAIELGAFVAFLIRKDDKNINDPLARIFIKPYFDASKSEIVYKPDQTIYGKYDKLFLSIVNEWVEKKNEEAAKAFNHAMINIYTLGPGIYNQEGKKNIIKINDLKGEISDKDLMNIVKAMADMNQSELEETVNYIKKVRPDLMDRLYDTIVKFIIES